MRSDPIDEKDNQRVLNTLLLEYIKEQKRKRRWKWFFRFVVLVLIVYSTMHVSKITDKSSALANKPHAGLIDISGVILDSASASANNLAASFDKAYKDKGTKAIVLRINSPGGSPVQADYMYSTIDFYRKKYPAIKVYAVCVDACTSAAYYIASAAENVYANPASIVGSIGVLYNGFGFVDAIQKLGIQRRLVTAGKNKGFLDPFSPVNVKQKADLEYMLGLIHQQFENRVKEGRGKRLHVEEDTFSGLFWTGVQAQKMGLIDGFASSGQLIRERLKLKHTVDYTVKQTYFEKFTKNFSSAIADKIITAMGLNPGFKA